MPAPTLNRATLCHRKSAFSGVFCAEGSIGTNRCTVLPCLYRRPDLCSPGAGPSRLAKKAGYKIAGVWKETASGAKDDRAERKEVLALAQARKIDVIVVTELTRWGRSMLDLFHTLQDLQAWGVSLVAQTGLQFDLRSAQGKLIASLMAALAEFERDLLRERVRSGIAAARKRGVVFGRRPGQRVKADRFAPKVLKLVSEGQSYREISHRLGLSKNSVLDIVKRDRAA
jgi:putative DNA-invertase from lambdoid prophage Rac